LTKNKIPFDIECPVALAGARAPSAPAWVGWLLANFIAGSALLVAGGWVRASASHSVQNQLCLSQMKCLYLASLRDAEE